MPVVMLADVARDTALLENLDASQAAALRAELATLDGRLAARGPLKVTPAPPLASGGQLSDGAAVSDMEACQVAARLAEVSALLARLSARLVELAQDSRDGVADDLLTVDECAALLRTSRDWLRRRTDLPFVVRLSDGAIRYSRRTLIAWIARRTGGQ